MNCSGVKPLCTHVKLEHKQLLIICMLVKTFMLHDVLVKLFLPKLTTGFSPVCAPNTEHFFPGTPKNRLPSIQDDSSSVASSKIGNTKSDLGGVKVSLYYPSFLPPNCL